VGRLDAQDDKEVVMTAVAAHGVALSYASAALKADVEVVEKAARSSGPSLAYAAEELLSDVTFLNQLLGRLPAAALEPLIVLHVGILSGRSCTAILDARTDKLRWTLLDQCAKKLDYSQDILLTHGELLNSSGETIADDEALRKLERSHVHELQLLVRSANSA